MPTFDDRTTADAPPEEVWKVLYDPGRFPDWWVGVGSVEVAGEGYTMYPEGYPDFPMPQLLETSRADGRVRISCLVSDLRFDWRLGELPGGGTEIAVHVEIPEEEAHRLEGQREAIAGSLRRLAALAESAA